MIAWICCADSLRSLTSDWSVQVSKGLREMNGRTAPAQLAPVRVEYTSAEEPDYNGMEWDMRTEDGDVNWGFVIFICLSVACGAVWTSLFLMWLSFRHHHAADASKLFVPAESKADLLEPLLISPLAPEAHLDSGKICGAAVLKDEEA